MTQQTISFIGGGNMASSLIGGLLADGYDPKRIAVSDPDSEKLAQLAARFGIVAVADNSDAVIRSDVLVLAVKPQILEEAAGDLARSVQTRKPLLVSIVAGVREKDLQRWLGGGIALVRAMPNTPALLQTGATALHADDRVSQQQRDQAETILRAVGLTRWVENEDMLDIVTALSGSGPAYFFLVMEALEQAGKQLGLPADTARLLILQTALGAARMAIESNIGPGELRANVTSPGGTTEKALQTLAEGGLQELIIKAVSDARERSKALSRMLGSA